MYKSKRLHTKLLVLKNKLRSCGYINSICFLFYFLKNRISLCSPGCLELTISTYRVLKLQVHATVPVAMLYSNNPKEILRTVNICSCIKKNKNFRNTFDQGTENLYTEGHKIVLEGTWNISYTWTGRYVRYVDTRIPKWSANCCNPCQYEVFHNAKLTLKFIWNFNLKWPRKIQKRGKI